MKIEGVLKKRLSHTHEQHTMTLLKATLWKGDTQILDSNKSQ